MAETTPPEPEPNPPESPLGSEIAPGMRIVLFTAGWALVIVGIAGLVLPGIQGVLTIAAGLALLSVVSRTIHRWIRRGLQRWPAMQERMERLRHKLYRRFRRKD
ncbi:MAG: PGPGW domain-containing protein [Acidobacteriota bacterium]